MANPPKFQVFISSTFEDLQDERDQVIRAVLEMGHIPVGMEMFSAADDEQWKIIARHIEESDYYAVIVAHRLGSLAEGGLSYTRKEYEYAIGKGIPVLGFVIDEKAQWPADRMDTGTGTKKALDDFKTLIREKPVGFWSNAEDLYGRFSVALMKAITANPREGWVRASSVGGGPEVTAEVVRLSAENAALRRQLQEAKVASDEEQNALIMRTMSTLLNSKRRPSYRYASSGAWQRDSEVSLLKVFRVLGPGMIVEATVDDMAKTLAMEIRKDGKRRWDIVALNQLRGLLADFMTLDLVQPSGRRHAVSDVAEYWSLSPLGNEMLKAIRKISLTEEAAAPTVPEEGPESSDDDTPATSDSDGDARVPADDAAPHV